MPERRHAGTRIRPNEPPVDLFRIGNGCWDYFGRHVYSSEHAAERAWRKPGIRRAVWAETYRLNLPGAAEAYDGLTRHSFEFLWNEIGHPTFNADVLSEALALVAADRQAVADFEADDLKGAQAIADYLAAWRSDLDTIERAAHIRASSEDDWVVGHAAARRLLSTGQLYGSPQTNATQ